VPEQYLLVVQHVGDRLGDDVVTAAGDRPDGPDEAGEVLLSGLPDDEVDVLGGVLLGGRFVLEGDLQFAVGGGEVAVALQDGDVVSDRSRVEVQRPVERVALDRPVALDVLVDTLPVLVVEAQLVSEFHDS
jgi:hypothetical protein